MRATIKARTVLCLAILLAGLAVLGLSVWESIHYRQTVDAVKAFLGVLIAVGGAWGLDPTTAHGFVGDAVSLGGALPSSIIGAIRGGRRQTDPPVVVAPPDPAAPVVVAAHDPEAF